MTEHFASPDGGNVVLLIGAPRSGTTWLAKILDSHPDVIYRHEPDTVLRNEKLPYLCPAEDVDRYRDEARYYLHRLLEVRSLKSAGSRPVFRKRYHWPITTGIRASLIYGLLAADWACRRSHWPRGIAIPDLISKSSSDETKIVLKSVSSRGRALLFAEALPMSRLVFIVRHPCGQVASMMRHVGSGSLAFGRLLDTAEAQQVGLTAERLAGLPLVERYAWHWTILNQKALNDISRLSKARHAVLRYEDACADPQSAARTLLAFAGLVWNQQTAAFISASTTAADSGQFYSTSRDSLAAANRWRNSLTEMDQRRILDIAVRLPVGEMFGA